MSLYHFFIDFNFEVIYYTYFFISYINSWIIIIYLRHQTLGYHFQLQNYSITILYIILLPLIILYFIIHIYIGTQLYFLIIFSILIQQNSNMIQEYQILNCTIHLQNPSLSFSKLNSDFKSYQPLIRIKFAEYEVLSHQIPICIKQNHWAWQQVFVFRDLSNDQSLIIQILQQSTRQVKLNLSYILKLGVQSINICFNEDGNEGNFMIGVSFEQELVSSNQEKKQKISSKRSAIKKSSLNEYKQSKQQNFKENKEQLQRIQIPKQPSKTDKSSKTQQRKSDTTSVQAEKLAINSKKNVEITSSKRGSQTSKTVQKFIKNQKLNQKTNQKQSQKQLSSKRNSNQNLLSKRSDINMSKRSQLNNLSNRQKQILNSQKLINKTDQKRSSRSNLPLKNSMQITKSIIPQGQSNINSKRISQQKKLNPIEDSQIIDKKLNLNRSDYSHQQSTNMKQSKKDLEVIIDRKQEQQKHNEHKNQEELYQQSYQQYEEEVDIAISKEHKNINASRISNGSNSNNKVSCVNNNTQKQQQLHHNAMDVQQNKQSVNQYENTKDIKNIVKQQLKNIQQHIFQLQQAKENDNKLDEFQELINARKKANQQVLLEVHQPFLQKLEQEKYNQMQQYNNQEYTQNKGTTIYQSRLGEIAKNIRARYGDKIYENQSAATMQKSIHCYSVPKGPRFVGFKYNGVQPSYYVKTCFQPLGQKGTSFGFGNRKAFPDWLQRNMKQIPAPNTYLEKSMTLQSLTSPKGYSFGIPHSYYKKVRIIGAQNQIIANKNLSRTESMSKLQKKDTVKMPRLSNHYHYNQIYKYR